MCFTVRMFLNINNALQKTPKKPNKMIQPLMTTPVQVCNTANNKNNDTTKKKPTSLVLLA